MNTVDYLALVSDLWPVHLALAVWVLVVLAARTLRRAALLAIEVRKALGLD